MFSSWLTEYLLVAKYLNISHAARELHMSQPNLSRHIHLLETELNYKLVRHCGNQISLTNAGKLFADRIPSIIHQFKEINSACMQLAENEILTIRVQTPPYNDEAGKAYMRLLNQVINQNNKYQFEYISMSRKRFKDEVLENNVACAVIYMSGSREQAQTTLEGEGFKACFLATVPFDIWIKKESPLASSNQITIEDLPKLHFALPNNPSYPLKHAYLYLINSHNLQPNYVDIQVNGRLNLASNEKINAAYLYPRMMRNDCTINWRDDLTPVPLCEEGNMHVFAIEKSDATYF